MASVRDLYSYNTSLSDKERESLYELIMGLSLEQGSNRFKDMEDYDMAGAYREGLLNNPSAGHLPDTYKKPAHPTFSTESIYNGVDGNYGGQWNKDSNGWVFTPSQTNLENSGESGLRQYFKEVEPDARINFGGGNDMAVHYMQNNNGGGFFSRLLPQVLNMAGTTIGGPMGGKIGSLIGNAATGNNAGLANQIIGSINPSAGNPAPTQTQFPGFQGTDWGDPKSYTEWLKMRG